MGSEQVEEKAVYCKRINGTMICYQVVKVFGNAIRLKNVDGIQPEFATTVEKLFKSQYVRRDSASSVLARDPLSSNQLPGALSEQCPG